MARLTSSRRMTVRRVSKLTLPGTQGRLLNQAQHQLTATTAVDTDAAEQEIVSPMACWDAPFQGKTTYFTFRSSPACQGGLIKS